MSVTESLSPIRIQPAILEAYQVLDAQPLPKELALRLAALQGEDILDLISLANKVKNKFALNAQVCTILNAKSGACTEDCKFCSQSGHHSSQIEVYPLLTEAAIMDAARKADQNGVKYFGLVTSGAGYDRITPEYQSILNAIYAIHVEFPNMEVCASFGILSDVTVRALANASISHYNINLQVNPARYADLISTTHSIESRIQTIRLLQEHGIKTCVGGILGLGESMDDRIELAYALKEFNVDVVPLNVLIPIEGTAMEKQAFLPTADIAKTFSLFRLIMPSKTIKFAAGRETRMKDFQGLLMLAGANGLLTGGYLTTRGRDTNEDLRFIQELEGFGTVSKE